jgi:ring-1,2-phenylacetyl-CoA epoxidase subunit PaaC
MSATKELLFKMADDALIIGHRNSEWTGIGPVLEEDLAFSSMAQDKIGHASALYNLLHEHFGEADADSLGFKRTEKDFKCCHLVELPIGEYDFSLVRHFLFDHAELLRYEMLVNSSFAPLASLAKKVKGEIKYHVMHADTWIRQLANGNEESKARVQSSLNYTWPFALGIFETTANEDALINEKVFEGEAALKKMWLERVSSIISSAGLTVPSVADESVAYGGRKGFHTEYLQPMLAEMTEVTSLDTEAEW